MITRNLVTRFVAFFLSVMLSSSAARADAPPAGHTLIYALGASLFYQNLDGSKPTEEKLALPAGSVIDYLTGARDRHTLAFSAARTIYFYDTVTKQLAAVHKDHGMFLFPSISPDGLTVSCRPYKADATLCILSRDGTVRDLGPATAAATTSAFSPDGKTIYFSTGPRLKYIATAGGDAETVQGASYAENFNINDEGMLVSSMPFDNTGVVPILIDKDGQLTRLEFPTNDFFKPSWSQTGTDFAYSTRKRYSDGKATGLYIWTNVMTKSERKKISDAEMNNQSGIVWW